MNQDFNDFYGNNNGNTEKNDNHYASIYEKYIYLIVCKSPTNNNYYLTDSSSDYYICRDN